MTFSPSKILINGKFVNSEFSVSVFSPSFQYGLNVFEGIRSYLQDDGSSVPFLLEEHAKRLIQSARLIGFECKIDINTILNDINILLEESKIDKDIYIKYLLCVLGEGNWSQVDCIDRVVFYYPLKSNLNNSQLNSTANFSSIKRISNNAMPPQIKCGANYVNSRMAALESARSGFDFPFLLNENGFISESSGSCIFIIKEKVLLTPYISSHVLSSITRNKIIKMANNIPQIKKIVETNLTRYDILSADEIFLVGTNIEIRPITFIDGHKFIPNITLDIMYKLSKLVRTL